MVGRQNAGIKIPQQKCVKTHESSEWNVSIEQASVTPPGFATWFSIGCGFNHTPQTSGWFWLATFDQFATTFEEPNFPLKPSSNNPSFYPHDWNTTVSHLSFFFPSLFSFQESHSFLWISQIFSSKCGRFFCFLSRATGQWPPTGERKDISCRPFTGVVRAHCSKLMIFLSLIIFLSSLKFWNSLTLILRWCTVSNDEIPRITWFQA